VTIFYFYFYKFRIILQYLVDVLCHILKPLSFDSIISHNLEVMGAT
jgi:hypothetical protein